MMLNNQLIEHSEFKIEKIRNQKISLTSFVKNKNKSCKKKESKHCKSKDTSEDLEVCIRFGFPHWQ